MRDRDADSVHACADLAGRTGAREFQVGYLHEDPQDPDAPHPVSPAWYAHAQFRGARITAEGHRTPWAACDELAQRLLAGAQCQGCGKLVTVSAAGAWAQDSTLLDGTRWSKEDQAAAGTCHWRLNGDRWQQGCAHG